MVERGIQELCNLYTEMKKRFRAIKLDCLDEENALEHIVFSDIKNYLTELLNIIPKDIDIHFADRLTIHLWKNAPYYSKDGDTLWTDIVLIDDVEAKECMAFDENFHSLQFVSFESKAEYLRLNTLEFMCSDWQEIKKSILNQTAEQLNYYILSQLERIKSKQEKLQTFKDWGIGV